VIENEWNNLTEEQRKIYERIANENGINYYQIDKREVYSVRESIMYLDDEIDKSAFKDAKTIIDKYKLD